MMSILDDFEVDEVVPQVNGNGVDKDDESDEEEVEIKLNIEVDDPMEYIAAWLGDRVVVKMKSDRELKGKLHAFDVHLNMVLQDVEESITQIDVDEETFEAMYQTTTRNIEMLFVRGDGILFVSSLAEVIVPKKKVKKQPKEAV